MRDKDEPIQDLMQEGQQPTKLEDCQLIHKNISDANLVFFIQFSFRRINHVVLHHLH
jgi:hypothetical protein